MLYSIMLSPSVLAPSDEKLNTCSLQVVTFTTEKVTPYLTSLVTDEISSSRRR